MTNHDNPKTALFQSQTATSSDATRSATGERSTPIARRFLARQRRSRSQARSECLRLAPRALSVGAPAIRWRELRAWRNGFPGSASRWLRAGAGASLFALSRRSGLRPPALLALVPLACGLLRPSRRSGVLRLRRGSGPSRAGRLACSSAWSCLSPGLLSWPRAGSPCAWSRRRFAACVFGACGRFSPPVAGRLGSTSALCFWPLPGESGLCLLAPESARRHRFSPGFLPFRLPCSTRLRPQGFAGAPVPTRIPDSRFPIPDFTRWTRVPVFCCAGRATFTQNAKFARGRCES
jgi:hypothetical protein